MKAKKIVLVATFSALIFVVTAFLAIPVAIGYFNFGDTFVMLASILLGPIAGGICGAVGATLADLYASYAMYAPFTLVIKFLEGFVCGLIFKLLRKHRKSYFLGILLGVVCGALLMAGGYVVANTVLYGFPAAIITSLPADLMQAGSSIVTTIILVVALSQIDYVARSFNLRKIFKKRKHNYGEENRAKRVAVINDLSSFGKCSLTASMPIFSCMGLQACPLPTAVLSCQTGFDDFFKQDMTFVWDDYFASWRKMGVTFDAIQSGYVTSASQVKKIAEFVEEFGKGSTLFVVDPVLGDDGQLYPSMTEEMVQEMRNLIGRANFCTPNLTELCLLCGENPQQVLSKIEEENFFEYLQQLCKKIFDLGCPAVVVTGIRRKNQVHNYVLTLRDEFITSSPSFKANMSGAGDIFCSILTAEVMTGKTLVQAVEVADEFLTKAIMDTTKGKYDTKHGINFEKHLRELT